MKRHWMLKGIKFVLFGLLAVGVCGFVVMSLWNQLMPAVFGLGVITFWQALGLLVLSRLLFGGFRGGARHGHWRGRMAERWQQMTPEERDRFRTGLGGRCGHFGPRGAEPSTPATGA